MRIKRISALLLALILLFTFAACGAKEMPDDENENEQSEEDEEGTTPISFSVMTYNTQNSGVSKGNEESHDAKYTKLAGMIDQKKPDIIALQECATTDAAASIRRKLADKDNYAVVPASISNAHTALIYKKTVFEKTGGGCQKIGTKGDETGSAYDRYLQWVRLRHIESGTEFVVIPVHVDYVKAAYLAQLQKIVDYLKEEQAGVSAILMGDFNAKPDSLKSSSLNTERYYSAREQATDNRSKNTDTFLGEGGGIIDHIFYKSSVGFRGLKSQYYEVLTNDEDNPSDHRPVYAEFSFGKK